MAEVNNTNLGGTQSGQFRVTKPRYKQYFGNI